MIVITSPDSVTNEFDIISEMFQEGLSLLHIRKPDFSITEMQQYLDRLPILFRHKLVLHQHHELAEAFGINRIHIRESDRATPDRFPKPVRCYYSTGTHTVKEFNNLQDHYTYAFLSPVFKSISKPGYQSSENLLETIKNRTNHNTKLIALGGITISNMALAMESGFDTIALLGTLWNSPDPVKNFRECLHHYNTIKN
ncbi:thiamine phosphate synthase [Flavobacterium sp.]|uniref:thiamine phosphate synthase n=1 Tax=Flavobacterium sp. TaxID=239 RepID=UPI00260F215F|nr:thiamine phosphate synthase [Flavobacterium sp.]